MREPSVARAPTLWEIASDRCFRGVCFIAAWLTVATVGFIILEVTKTAWPILFIPANTVQTDGTSVLTEEMDRSGPAVFNLGFLTSSVWDNNRGKYGIRDRIWGTVYTSMIALLLGSILGVAVAIVLSEDYLPHRHRMLLKSIVELLAAIPSVIYGLWGIFVVIPAIFPLMVWLHEHANWPWLPLFSTPFRGPSVISSTLVLTIMILPTISSLSYEALANVPRKLREGALGLGATRWEALLHVVLPTAAPGIFGAMVLGLGRALGETMAVTMLIGNSSSMSWSLFTPAETLTTLVASKFPEADGLAIAGLMYASLVLLVITLVVNMAGAAILWTVTRSQKGS